MNNNYAMAICTVFIKQVYNNLLKNSTGTTYTYTQKLILSSEKRI